MSSEAEAIIRQQIARIPGKHSSTSSDEVINCPWHGGHSLGIYTVPNGKLPFGFFNCFGCPESGPWNKLAEKLGLQTVAQRQMKRTSGGRDEAEHSKLRQELLPVKDHISMPYGIEFNDREWRGISGDLVRRVGGILGYDHHTRMTALYLPVRGRRSLVAFIKANLEKAKGKGSNYFVTGKVADEALFPYPVVLEMLATGRYAYVVLVEGPRDALFLIDHGIPALAILGSNNWSDRKRRLVQSLCTRYDVRPLVMMDADEGKINPSTGLKSYPGQEAQVRIRKDFRAAGLLADQVPLDKYRKRLKLRKLDPATLPKKLLKRVRKLVRAKK